ncbi:unnamed protein product [Caenorhabditis bovis]|uniref:Uncharacterized protein n=1 Tax=Caenorhabditis bovis TaxID=2654633 RepID=A0A8S1F466_9PELO|nr:unnamed protein product [Caenorhabditis bovis]
MGIRIHFNRAPRRLLALFGIPNIYGATSNQRVQWKSQKIPGLRWFLGGKVKGPISDWTESTGPHPTGHDPTR